ncbi:MAG: amidase domain-containing protein [Clostridium sp.]|uniref:amidase domain-containing protein n=1 Tax=Clostridium sp. TaxID=1506 RepID=UPI0025C1BD96|nr:amidase domain-containing protein [Clostridium sp.]MCH3963211.1 amidase domain-containing protein [Clostridium sp.]MCI1716326.1 amidase domain-containing protein [Clostridium sp.]MCI1800666.1 amidase domain-containing protein [Clostridium sp.]MCI1814679.1 amidase domain-containing protein [Clostridium sp.]MCI1871589.1 amidase domain-containing protein [Clostridium sp.]
MKFHVIKINFQFINICIIVFLFLNLVSYTAETMESHEMYNGDEIKTQIQKIFVDRNKAILNGNLKLVEGIYDKNTKYGTWAYEYEEKKMKYIKNWEEKQGIKFIDITPKIVIRRIREKSDGKLSVNLICSTQYRYCYNDNPGEINMFRIGTSHVLNIVRKDNQWIITKEWYKDPFADSLKISNLKVDSIKQYILSQKPKDISSLNQRRKSAVEYADRYCGLAAEEKYGYSYNKKYRNYNFKGGDCANFASQILFEGGKFRKNSAWSYDKKGATRAWLNADGFKDYMVYSGRASVIAHGSYEKIYKLSYKLLPGDFVAYEKKGDVTHISMVTGLDSKGYPLVTCHNTDRDKVPWDLGWNDKNIKFWLIRVNY